MKSYTFILIFLILSSSTAICQTKEYLTLTKEITKVIEPRTPYIILAEPAEWESYCLEELMREKDYSIKLTPDEITLLENEIKKSSTLNWSKNFFKSAKFVELKTIQEIFSDKSKDWKYFKQNIGDGYYRFSQPIFYRNNTFCLIYSDYVSGGMPEKEGLTMYKKENGKWVVWTYYCSHLN